VYAAALELMRWFVSQPGGRSLSCRLDRQIDESVTSIRPHVAKEKARQVLETFLAVDGYLEIDELTLPPAVQAEYDKGRKVRASYLFEVSVSIRGKPWQLHRRTAIENSAIFRKFDELFSRWDAKKKTWVPNPAASPMLFNVFLDMGQSQTGKTLAFAVDLCVRVPEYEVDGLLFFKNHFEGGYLFRDMIMLEATPPATEKAEWKIEYRFANDQTAPKLAAIVREKGEALTFEIPIEQPRPPAIRARLRVVTRFWNDSNR
jgi:hypothetical protein